LKFTIDLTFPNLNRIINREAVAWLSNTIFHGNFL
jgi:hypothetical protein